MYVYTDIWLPDYIIGSIFVPILLDAADIRDGTGGYF